LNFDGHPPSIVERGLVHLSDGGRGHRSLAEAREQIIDAGAEIGFQDVDGELRVHWWSLGLKPRHRFPIRREPSSIDGGGVNHRQDQTRFRHHALGVAEQLR
jgi:hypothetical protein